MINLSSLPNLNICVTNYQDLQIPKDNPIKQNLSTLSLSKEDNKAIGTSSVPD